jgi:dolichol-phosphate mannosyltransferase
MLIRLNAIEARVADVPLPSRYADEPSSLRPGRIALQFPARLMTGFVRRVFWRYVFYDVSPVALFLFFGSLLFAFGAIFGAYHWIWGAIHDRPTQTGTVIVAAVPFILGFQLLLQALVLDIQNTPRAESRKRPEPSTALATAARRSSESP